MDGREAGRMSGKRVELVCVCCRDARGKKRKGVASYKLPFASAVYAGDEKQGSCHARLRVPVRFPEEFALATATEGLAADGLWESVAEWAPRRSSILRRGWMYPEAAAGTALFGPTTPRFGT